MADFNLDKSEDNLPFKYDFSCFDRLVVDGNGKSVVFSTMLDDVDHLDPMLPEHGYYVFELDFELESGSVECIYAPALETVDFDGCLGDLQTVTGEYGVDAGAKLSFRRIVEEPELVLDFLGTVSLSISNFSYRPATEAEIASYTQSVSRMGHVEEADYDDAEDEDEDDADCECESGSSIPPSLVGLIACIIAIVILNLNDKDSSYLYLPLFWLVFNL